MKKQQNGFFLRLILHYVVVDPLRLENLFINLLISFFLFIIVSSSWFGLNWIEVLCFFYYKVYPRFLWCILSILFTILLQANNIFLFIEVF